MEHAKHYISLREEFPNKFDDHDLEYVRELGIAFNISLVLKDHKVGMSCQTKLENHPHSTAQIHAECIHYGITMRLVLALDTGNEALAKSSADKIQPYLNLLQEHLRPEFFQKNLYYLSYYYCVTHQWEVAKRTLELLLNHTKPKSRTPFWEFAKVLTLVCLYEMGDWYDLEEEIDRVKRFVKGEAVTFDLVGKMTQTLEELLSTTSPSIFLRKQLLEYEELKTVPGQNKAFEYFDPTEWIESQIGSKKWIEIKKDRFLQHENPAKDDTTQSCKSLAN